MFLLYVGSMLGEAIGFLSAVRDAVSGFMFTSRGFNLERLRLLDIWGRNSIQLNNEHSIKLFSWRRYLRGIPKVLVVTNILVMFLIVLMFAGSPVIVGILRQIGSYPHTAWVTSWVGGLAQIVSDNATYLQWASLFGFVIGFPVGWVLITKLFPQARSASLPEISRYPFAGKWRGFIQAKENVAGEVWPLNAQKRNSIRLQILMSTLQVALVILGIHFWGGVVKAWPYWLMQIGGMVLFFISSLKITDSRNASPLVNLLRKGMEFGEGDITPDQEADLLHIPFVARHSPAVTTRLGEGFVLLYSWIGVGAWGAWLGMPAVFTLLGITISGAWLGIPFVVIAAAMAALPWIAGVLALRRHSLPILLFGVFIGVLSGTTYTAFAGHIVWTILGFVVTALWAYFLQRQTLIQRRSFWRGMAWAGLPVITAVAVFWELKSRRRCFCFSSSSILSRRSPFCHAAYAVYGAFPARHLAKPLYPSPNHQRV